MKRVLVTDGVHPILIEKFKAAAFEVDYFTHYTNKEVHENIHLYNGIIINSKILVDKALLDKAEKLEFVGRLGSGMEIIDQDYAKIKGVKCYNSPEGNRDAVAEHAIGMLLSLFNNLKQADVEVRNFIWEREKNRGIELMGKTVGLMAYGNTGKAMAKKLSGFDVKVLAYDKYLTNFSDQYAQESSLQQIFEEADILSLHLPFTKETEGMINESFIQSFRKSIFLINTSRGRVLPTQALINGLNTVKIKGACLDVFENEHPEKYSFEEKNLYSDLAFRENVLLSPHIAGWTSESKEKLSLILIHKILGKN